MRLLELRTQKGLTLTKLADDLNMPVMTYHNYEKRRNDPNVNTLIKLADYFNVSLDYLCERQYNNNVGFIPDERKDLVKQVLALSDEDAKIIEAYITGFLAKGSK